MELLETLWSFILGIPYWYLLANNANDHMAIKIYSLAPQIFDLAIKINQQKVTQFLHEHIKFEQVRQLF